MPFDLSTIETGVANNKPRMLLYAMPKVGKTTFGSKFPNHLILNFDGSSERVDCTRTPRILSVDDFFDILTFLKEQPHNYKTLILDTVDWLEKLICDEVARINGKKTVEDIAYGRGYPLVVSRWREILDALESIRLDKNMSIIMLAHADVRKYSPPLGDEYDIYVPKLYGKKEKADTSLSLLLEFSDIIAFAHTRIRTKETGDGFNKKLKPVGTPEHVLYLTANNPCFVAGNRYSLTNELPFNYEAFINEFKLKTTKPKEVTKNV